MTTEEYKTLPLHKALEDGDLDECKLLIDDGADVKAKDSIGLTPLHIAAAKGYTEIVLILIEKGANIDAENYKWQTPLYAAAAKCQAETVDVLIQAGADVFVPTDAGITALDIAIFRCGKGIKIVDALRKAEEKQGGKNRKKAVKLVRK